MDLTLSLLITDHRLLITDYCFALTRRQKIDRLSYDVAELCGFEQQQFERQRDTSIQNPENVEEGFMAVAL
jgi:hypothetical protein